MRIWARSNSVEGCSREMPLKAGEARDDTEFEMAAMGQLSRGPARGSQRHACVAQDQFKFQWDKEGWIARRIGNRKRYEIRDYCWFYKFSFSFFYNSTRPYGLTIAPTFRLGALVTVTVVLVLVLVLAVLAMM
ncbi:unnamed protein product [Protopolystoma xenopodis]|uniref:Uncharacterized protein n=1 Tax=Protopolystoma xenopodis TaxID=117903 RepID=A0A448X579_9PLAT|nr:unnamed protein product [Protopolystoma xenopodis]